MEELILEKLTNIETLLLDKKKVLNINELAIYCGYSKYTIYKMVNQKIIPYSKPAGRYLFFDREKIDDWLLSNTSKSKQELKDEARRYTNNNR